MTEIIFTIAIIGLLAGFFSSMPIAGPVSILITSNALLGRLRYCNSLTMGASFGTFAYVFFAAFGLTKLFSRFKTAMPYLFLASFIILMIVGIRIFRAKIDRGYFEDNSQSGKLEGKSKGDGFYTGFIINFLNPTLLVGWIMNTFMVISFTSSIGLNTGGLDVYVNESVKEINNIAVTETTEIKITANKKTEIPKTPVLPQHFHLTISAIYALFAAAGSIIWFFILAFLMVRFRNFINLNMMSVFVKCMGIVLCLFGLYFGYAALKMILHLWF